MKHIKHWLATMAVLLCCITASAATYLDWTSTNQGQNNSTSSNTYNITASAGDALTFDWLVSSESGYDKLIVTLSGSEILNKSGEQSGTYQYTFTSSGSYTMVAKYTKDGSVNKGDDYAKVYNITLGAGDNIVASGTCGDNLTWKFSGNGTLTIEGAGEMTSCPYDDYDSRIKTVIVGEGVTSIGDNAFRDCSNLTTITIPVNSQLTSIGSSAFYNCSSLTSIILPESVTSIGRSAFAGCSSLIAIVVAEGNKVYDSRNGCNAVIETSSNTLIQGCSATIIPEGVTSIGNNAFYGCSRLETINIPEGVTSIGSSAFYNCSILTAIILPESVTSIGDHAFWRCHSLTALNIPEGVTSIGDSAFSDCTRLETINIPESVTSIGSDAFADCIALTSITIPEGVMNIGVQAFSRCYSLTAITIPENSLLTSIGDAAFNGCSGLKTITIPESVMSIGSSAFRACSGLKTITIPEGVTSIGDYAFYYCSSLTSITCEAITPPTIGGSYTFDGVNKSISIYVPESSMSAYKAASYWKEFANIIGVIPEEQTLTINEYGSGTYCSEYALDFSEVDGLKAYAATGYNTKTGIVTLTRVMTSQPGMGLFLKGEEGEYIVPVLESTDDNSLNMLVGTLGSTTINGVSDDGLYYNYRYTIKDGDEAPLFYRVDDGYTLSAGKAYLQIPVAWMPAEAKSISLRFDDEDGTTDIEEMESANQNAEVIYDLLGRKVGKPQEGGVYIVNGKKMVW